MGKRRWGIVAAIALLAVLIGSLSWHIPPLSSFERAVFDAYRYALAERIVEEKRIAVVIFDEAVMRETGKTAPLDRKVLAAALRNIDALQPKSIGLDLIFTQPTADDDELIAAFRGLKSRTYLAYADPAFDATSYWGPDVADDAAAFQDEFWNRLDGNNVRRATPVLGFDPDGIARRWPILEPGHRLPLAAAMANAPGFDGYQGSIRFARIADNGDSGRLDDATGMFSPIRVTNLADPEWLGEVAEFVRGRHVLIGADSFNIDQISNPITRIGGIPAVAGVFAHAHMLRQALSDERPEPFPYPLALLLCLVFAAAGAWSATSEGRPLLLAGAIAVQLAILAALPTLADRAGIDFWGLPVVGVLMSWLAAYLATLFAARGAGSEARLFAHHALGKYLPEAVARQIIAHPEALKLSGERRSLFIMFTDLQGFTKFSHKLPPEETAIILNDYLARMSEIILAHCGTIDKFVGDAIVAFWGAPLASSDDARNALACAIALDAASSQFAGEQKARGHDLGITRVGLHHGEAVVGNFGAAKRIQYTAIGDAMNTAARLESANKSLGTRILVSDAAAKACGLARFRPLGAIRLSGVATAITVFEPVPEAAAAYADAFKKAFGAATRPTGRKLAPLRTLQSEHPDDRALALLVERLTKTRAGDVYELQTK